MKTETFNGNNICCDKIIGEVSQVPCAVLLKTRVTGNPEYQQSGSVKLTWDTGDLYSSQLLLDSDFLSFQVSIQIRLLIILNGPLSVIHDVSVAICINS